MARNASRNAEILAFYRANKWSYGLVANKFGVSRNVVAGIVFRDNYPLAIRKKHSPKRPNMIGTGRVGCRYQPKYRIGNADARSAPRVREVSTS